MGGDTSRHEGLHADKTKDWLRTVAERRFKNWSGRAIMDHGLTQ
jgi:hypothetical protein